MVKHLCVTKTNRYVYPGDLYSTGSFAENTR